jgi:hypothetical protein
LRTVLLNLARLTVNKDSFGQDALVLVEAGNFNRLRKLAGCEIIHGGLSHDSTSRQEKG